MRLKKGLFMLLELLLRIAVNPYLRADLLKVFGAKIGRNTRVYEVCFFNLENGFGNFVVCDDVHIGVGCRLDLQGKITIARGATLSPGVTILTHADPGSNQHSPLCKNYPPIVDDVEIGEYSWIGANTTILAGTSIGHKAVVGACSLVRGNVQSESLYFGIPAKRIKALIFD